MKSSRVIVYVVMMILLFQLLPGSSISYSQKIIYPKTRTTNDVDFYFGNKVFDPYRWLEDIDSTEVQAWVSEQMQLTRSYLDTETYRENIKTRLLELSRFNSWFVPQHRGNRYFYFKRATGQNQTALYMRESLEGEPRVIVDPNWVSISGTTAITDAIPSPDGKLLAYALSYGGSDFQEVHFLDIDAGRELADTLKWCKFVNLVWKPDNSGCFYTRWAEPDEKLDNPGKKPESLYWHRLGTNSADDSLAFEDQSDDKAILWLECSSDSRYLIIHKQNSKNYKYNCFYKDLAGDSSFIQLLENEEGKYNFIDNIGSVFYFQTELKAPGGKIIAIDTADKKEGAVRYLPPVISSSISRSSPTANWL